MSGLLQAGVVRRTNPFSRGTLMVPLAQAMVILRKPRPCRRVDAHRQPRLVMQRPAPESDMQEPWQPRRSEAKPSRGFLVTCSGNMITATAASAHDADGELTNSTMEAHISKRITALEDCRQSPITEAGRPIGPRLNARTKLANNLHQLAHNKTSPVWARRVATCGWPRRAQRRA